MAAAPTGHAPTARAGRRSGRRRQPDPSGARSPGLRPLHLDALQARCGLDTATLQAQLLELELAARVARLDDGRFQRLK
ncbi:hypothetical protein WJ971_06295 [Achromobacter xylosoxidans]